MQLDKRTAAKVKHPDPTSNTPIQVMAKEPRGFGLRVYPSGRKVWFIRYRTKDGRRRFYQLGDYPTTTLNAARDLARKELGVIPEGGDPAAAKEAVQEAVTVADLCARFLDEYAPEYRPGSLSEDRRRLDNHVKQAWSNRLAQTIEANDVRKLHACIGANSKTEANRVIELVRRVWNVAEEWGLMPEGYRNPATAVRRFRETSRERWLTADEMTRLLNAIDGYGRETSEPESLCAQLEALLAAEGPVPVEAAAEEIEHDRQKTAMLLASLVDQGRAERVETGVYAHRARLPVGDARFKIYVRAALWLYILTGMRKSELLSARWDQIDWGREVFRLPRTKSGRAHEVPLPPTAINILKTLPRVEGNVHIFPGRKPGSHIVNIDKAWRTIRRTAELEDVRLHDLRRTVGSWLVQAGNSLLVVQRALNHSTYQAALVYARMSEDPVRKALEDHEKRILDTVDSAIVPAGNGGE